MIDEERLTNLALQFNDEYNAAWDAATDRINENYRNIQAARNNELLQRKAIKQLYIDNLLGLRKVGEVLHSFEMSVGVDLPKERLAIGEMLTMQLANMEGIKKIRLSQDELKDIYRIPDEVWQANYGHSKGVPIESMEVLFVRRLSQEPFAKYLIQYLLEQIMEDSVMRGLLLSKVVGKRYWIVSRFINWDKIKGILSKAFGISQPPFDK